MMRDDQVISTYPREVNRKKALKMNKAYVIHGPGGPEVLKLEEREKPKVKPGWTVVKIMAFGLNRAEVYTRQGMSGDRVKWPRVIGIEAVGIVEEDGTGKFPKGSRVCSLMGEMGRAFDGSYQQFALLPDHCLHKLPEETKLSWTKLGSIPEMFQTTFGSLHQSLDIQRGETLLIRGGTSSVGMLALGLAKKSGCIVISTTRKEERIEFLKEKGADHVVVDTGSISSKIKSLVPNGVDKVLELVGVTTIHDSLRCCRKRGIVCNTGMLCNKWVMPNFAPFSIPSTVRLTSYAGGSDDLDDEALSKFIKEVEEGSFEVPIDKVFQFQQLVEAHRYMDESRAKGKIVVEVDHNK